MDVQFLHALEPKRAWRLGKKNVRGAYKSQILRNEVNILKQSFQYGKPTAMRSAQFQPRKIALLYIK